MSLSRIRTSSKRRGILTALAVAGSMTLLLGACSSGAEGDTGEQESDIAVNEKLRDMLPERILDSNTVVIGGSFDNPPVLYADESDATKPAGVAYDLSVAIGKVLGIEPDWRNTQWAGQLPGLDSGALDIAWGQASVTEEREREQYDMIPFYLAPLAVLVSEGNPKEITSFESMCGATTGGSTGSVFEFYVGQANEKFCTPNGKPEITYKSFNGTEEVALSSGTIDGVIDAWPVLSTEAKGMKGVEAVKLSDADQFDTGLVGITFSKDEPKLSAAFSAALQQLWDDGVYQEILKKNEVPDATLERDQLSVNVLTGTPAGERK